MYQIIIFSVTLLPLFLFADPHYVSSESEVLESTGNPLTTLYGVPQTNILGVNVINGDYNYACVDFSLPGADPLILQRSYSSSNDQTRAFYLGWTHNLSGYAITYPSKKFVTVSSKKILKEFFHVVTSGSLSGELPFRTDLYNNTEEIKLNRDVLKKGVTNCGKGEISGRTNIKNMGVYYKGGLGIRIKNGDGTEHRYRRIIERPQPGDFNSEDFDADSIPPRDDYNPYLRYDHTHALEETIKPNGLKTVYSVNEYLLHHVQTLTHCESVANKIIFNPPTFIPKKDEFSFTGTSKDGKEATYTFKTFRFTKRPFVIALMSKFESNCIPAESYTYTDSKDGSDKLKERIGAQHLTRIEYYNKGDWVNIHGLPQEEISGKHFARHRVKQLSVAVNGPEDVCTAYHFSYYKDNKTKNAFTDAYNSKNFLTRFCYSTKNHRVTSIERFKGNSDYALYRTDRLEFGKKLTSLEGDLLFKTVENADKIIHYGENLDYDENGNVLKRKQHYRSFKKDKVHSISIKENNPLTGNRRLKGGEVKATVYTYNSLHLPTSEDDGRLKTVFTYHERNGKNTNLLKSKLFQKNENIVKREFYEFDGNAGCTLKIEDDGVTSSSEDLTGLKHRKVTRCINREGQFAGLPLEIDVWGSNGQEEKRISRTVLEYDSHGYVEKEQHYNANNQLAYLTHKIRDLQGNITSETNPLGQTTQRKYNEYGSLWEVQGPSLKYYMEYKYDWLQRPIEETRKCADGIHLTTSRKYDLEDRLTEITDTYGFQTQFIYNEQGRPTEIIYPPVRTDSGEWVRHREFKQYNFLGYLTSETDAKGAATIYTPNDAGLPLKITYADGTFEEFRYSIYGEILEKIQRNGSKVVYVYDDLSRLTSETIYDRDGQLLKTCSKEYSGLLLSSETDGEGLTKKYLYDYAGRVSEISHGNSSTKYIYDSLGRLEEEQRYFGENEKDYVATRFSYDLLNRVIRKKEVDGEGQTHSKIVTTYDRVGNVATTKTRTHAGTAISTYNYDARGNLRSSKDPLGNKIHYIQRYDYFLKSKNLPCLEVIDSTGVKTTTISDPSGAVIITQVHSPFGKLLSNTELFYDLNRNLTRKEEHLPHETLVTLFEYDSCSRLIRQVNGAGTPEQITTTFVYNSFGELSETQYSDGTSKHRTYDGIGRLFEEWSDDKCIHYQYTYNGQGLPTEVKNLITKNETIRKYTPEGNLHSEQFENGLQITYHYDRINRIVECIYPDGSSVKQTYNPVFLTKTERIKDDSVIYTSTFTKFDQAGKPKYIDFPKKSGRLSLKYDPLNRTTSLSYPHYTEQEICYDKRGLLTSKLVNEDLQTFDHDHLQQLTLEKTEKYSHTYENDALHRQTSVDEFKQTHNAVHQLTKGIHDQYTYDAKGRRVQDSKTRFTYDKFDRLIAAEQGDSTWNYTYDAFNRKMSRTFAGETTQYLYNGHEDIGSYRDTKCLDLKILSSKEGSLPLAIELGDQQYAPLISSHGHIIGLVEMETGNPADQSQLTLFGKDLAGNPLSPWRFCGKRHEEANLGIIDFGYRFYHPKSAQWLTQDPLGESSGPNLYTYVNNNPACCVDRFGLFMDNFSFSSAWESFKDTCSNSWDSFKDTCSNAWESARDYCSGRSQISYDGAARCIRGGCETISGGFVATRGGLPGFVTGGLITLHGVDNCTAGWNQFTSGEIYDPYTIQLLEKAGMSHDAASMTNDFLSTAGIGAAGITALTAVSSVMRSGECFANFSRSESVISETTIQFGRVENQQYHTFRHIESAGIDRRIVQSAIEKDIMDSAKILNDGINCGSVTVNNIVIEYNAYILPNGVINVGRITLPK